MNTHRIAKLDLDPARLADDLRRSENFNFSDAYGEFICGEWRSCMLWNEKGDVGNTLLSNHDQPAMKTAYGLEMPYVSEVITRNFDMSRLRFARLVKLRPHSVIIPHRDFLELGQGLIRIHLPLVTDSNCFSGQDDVVYQMKVGEVWFIDATRVHSAASFSQQDRLHLILDFAHGDATSPLSNVTWNPNGSIADESIARRAPLTAADEEAISSLHTIIDQDNYRDILALLIRKYYRTDFTASFVFDLLLRVAEKSGNRALYEEIKGHADYFLINRQQSAPVDADKAPARSSDPLLSSAELDQRIAELLERARLTSETNGFFQRAKAISTAGPSQALFIAHNWREMTKAFMFYTIKGIGVMAGQAARETRPPESLLRTIQTVFAVIGDDLNNTMSVFKEVAPPGIGGIHYIWWEDEVINPIRKHCDQDELAAEVTSTGTERLIESMERLSQSSVGTAVQLRVVEAIALEIAVAFKRVFGRLEVDGKRLFPRGDDLPWMNAHIRAEVTHNQQVSDHDVGMAGVADTVAKQQEMLAQTAEYVERWSQALGDFETALNQDVTAPLRSYAS